MATTINADTSDGLKLTADASGEIKLQSAGTDIASVTANGMDVTGDFTVDTTTLYVDATNNRVGIGTSSPTELLEISAGATTNNPSVYLSNSSGYAGKLYAQSDLVFGTGTGATERIRILSANGNVGIGTSSPARPLEVKQSADSFISITAGNTNSSVLELGDSDDINIGRILYNHGSNYLSMYTNNTERMRIQSTGDVLIGTTSDIAAGSEGVEIKGNLGYIVTARNTTAAASHQLFFNPNGIVGSIQTSGTATSYVTSSDYRLKENVAPMSGSIDRLKQLKPSTWAWIQDGSHGEGFLAHEAQEVVPNCATGTKDAVDDEGKPVYQGIDQSKLVPLLTSALQEAITKIEDLETRIEALENA